MKFPKNEFLTKRQDTRVKARQSALLAQIQELLKNNGMSEADAAINSARISESWEIMMRLCQYVENLAGAKSLCDAINGEAIPFSPEASAEIIHLESNLSAFKKSVADIGDLAEKTASNDGK